MKKITILMMFIGLGLASFGQAVADNALIPISITLNSILRMNVTSGGNIDFTVNTLDDYENGIDNTARYQTKFTVSSSRNFAVAMYAEDATFIGSDDASNTMDLNYCGYSLTSDGTYADGAENTLAPATGSWAALSNTSATIITSGTGNAGDINANSFTIMWELGTSNIQGATGGNANTLKQGNFPSDRYATNVFLVLSAL